MRGAVAATKWLVICVLGAAVAAAVDLAMIGLEAQRNPHDQLYRQSIVWIFVDPFVITIAAPIVLVSGVAAFFLAYVWLHDTVIWKTATLIYAAVLAELILVGLHDPLKAWYWSYIVLVSSAVASKWLFKHKTEPHRP